MKAMRFENIRLVLIGKQLAKYIATYIYPMKSVSGSKQIHRPSVILFVFKALSVSLFNIMVFFFFVLERPSFVNYRLSFRFNFHFCAVQCIMKQI